MLYAASTSLPGLLQSLFGYDAYASGLVLSPRASSRSSMLLIVGVLLGRGVDARWLIAAGLLVMAAGNYWMSLMNLEISPWQVVWPRDGADCGLALIFAPLNVAAFMYTPKHLRGAAVGLLALLRNEGGSVGTSMAQTIQERRDQFHTVARGRIPRPLQPARAIPSWSRPRPSSSSKPATRPGRNRWPCKRSSNLREQQAASLAYFDVFWAAAVLGVGFVLLGAAHEALGGREGRPRWRRNRLGSLGEPGRHG